MTYPAAAACHATQGVLQEQVTASTSGTVSSTIRDHNTLWLLDALDEECIRQ